jgi:hypothetical protein
MLNLRRIFPLESQTTLTKEGETIKERTPLEATDVVVYVPRVASMHVKIEECDPGDRGTEMTVQVSQ